jgi:NADH dehydrogenase (ubiquinone) Fe-S protein 5
MRAMNCLEAYGVDRGMKKCKDLIDDFRECSTHKKQVNRLYEMLCYVQINFRIQFLFC